MTIETAFARYLHDNGGNSHHIPYPDAIYIEYPLTAPHSDYTETPAAVERFGELDYCYRVGTCEYCGRYGLYHSGNVLPHELQEDVRDYTTGGKAFVIHYLNGNTARSR